MLGGRGGERGQWERTGVMEVFRGARLSILPTNACLAKDNIPFPSFANHIVLSKFWKIDLDRRVI